MKLLDRNFINRKNDNIHKEEKKTCHYQTNTKFHSESKIVCARNLQSSSIVNYL